MSGKQQPQHDQHVQQHEPPSNQIISAAELDFTSLFPTPQQIETFNSPSTGNTPLPSPLTPSSEGDSYSPPMSFAAASPLPADREQDRQFRSEGLEKLMKWLDTLTAGMDKTRGLTGADFAAWKAFLQGFRHEEYCEALGYAADKVVRMREKLLLLKKKKEEEEEEEDSGVGGGEGEFEGEEKGMSTGMPLRVIAWEEIVADGGKGTGTGGERGLVGTMTTMAVKSGILQACKGLRELEVKVFKKEEQRKKLRLEATDDDDDDDKQDFDVYSVFPVEGKFVSVEERHEIFGLPEVEREAILGKREMDILKRREDWQLKKALEASFAAAAAAAAGAARKSGRDATTATARVFNPDEIDVEMDDGEPSL